VKRDRGCRILLIVLSAGLACVPGEGPATDAIVSYLDAVQQVDLDRLYCVSTGASRAAELGSTPEERRARFEEWFQAQEQRYLDGRDAGWVELDSEPIPLVKLFALGKGTYFEVVAVRAPATGEMLVETTLHFGYSQLDLSVLSPGTTFYLAGAPAGRVHPVRVPMGSREVRLDVLDAITVEWRLVRDKPANGCPGGWTVAAALPVEGSELTSGVTWVF
jgi:hypothetical protein